MIQTHPVKPHHPRTQARAGSVYPEHYVKIHQYITEYIEKNQYPPTNREMVDAGFAGSTSVIRFYYGRMQEFGMLEIIPKISRGIRPIPQSNWK